MFRHEDYRIQTMGRVCCNRRIEHRIVWRIHSHLQLSDQGPISNRGPCNRQESPVDWT